MIFIGVFKYLLCCYLSLCDLCRVSLTIVRLLFIAAQTILILRASKANTYTGALLTIAVLQNPLIREVFGLTLN